MQNTSLNSKLKVALFATYSLYSLLLLLFVYWNINRESGFMAGVLIVQTLPLVALLPGMLKNRYRSFSWLCFILLFYFIFAVERVFSSLRGLQDFIFVTIVVALFIASMMASRWLQRQQKLSS